MNSVRKPKVLLIGASHTERIFWAYEKIRNTLDFELVYINLNEPSIQPWHATDNGAFIMGPHLAERVRNDTSANDIDLYVFHIGGSSHFILGSVNHPDRYDFVFPSRPDLPPDGAARLVPYDLVHALFLNEETRIHDPFRVMKGDGVPVVCLIPPPPVFDANYVLEWLPANMKARGAELGIAPETFRLKVWLAYVEAIRQIYEGSPLILPPPACVNERGFIRDVYRGDAVHGTTEYGGFVLGQISDHLRTLGGLEAVEGNMLVQKALSIGPGVPVDLRAIRTIREIRFSAHRAAAGSVDVEVAIAPDAWVTVTSEIGSDTGWTIWRPESHAWARFVRLTAREPAVLWDFEIRSDMPAS